MKQVIAKLPVEYMVEASMCSDEFYYGVINADKIKGFVIKTDYRTREGSMYKCLCTQGFTYGNCFFTPSTSTSLQRLIESVLSNKDCFVYQFNTFEELFNWLIS